MVELITLQESLAFSLGALLFGLITARLRPELRRSILITLLLIGAGLCGLALLSNYEIIPSRLSIAVVPREICLLIVALGNIRIYITFLVNVVLARRAVPRILGEVAIALSLIVFYTRAPRRGRVNLPASSLRQRWRCGLGFALQSTLGNLMGGIRFSSTTRIASATGSRWMAALLGGRRHTLVPHRSGDGEQRHRHHSECAADEQSSHPDRRRGDLRIPWRRRWSSRFVEWTPTGHRRRQGCSDRVAIPLVASEPAAHCLHRFRWQRDQVRRVLLAHRPPAVYLPTRGCASSARCAGPRGHRDSDRALDLYLHSAARRPPRSARAAPAAMLAARAFRVAYRRQGRARGAARSYAAGHRRCRHQAGEPSIRCISGARQVTLRDTGECARDTAAAGEFVSPGVSARWVCSPGRHAPRR
jgi:hypothetical protein